MPWATEDDLYEDYAASLHLESGAQLKGFQRRFVRRRSAWAKSLILNTVKALGYTAAQAELWDDAEEYHTSQTLYWCLISNKAGFADAESQVAKELDRRDELKELSAPLWVGGVLTNPTAPDPEVTTLSAGVLNARKEFDRNPPRW